ELFDNHLFGNQSALPRSGAKTAVLRSYIDSNERGGWPSGAIDFHARSATYSRGSPSSACARPYRSRYADLPTIPRMLPRFSCDWVSRNTDSCRRTLHSRYEISHRFPNELSHNFDYEGGVIRPIGAVRCN